MQDREEAVIYRMTGDEIGRYWETLRHAIQSSLPPTTEAKQMAEIQQSLLDGSMNAWAVNNNKGPIMLVTTMVVQDEFGPGKDFLLYTLYAVQDIRPYLTQGLSVLRRVAKSMGCRRVVYYTLNDNLARLAQRVGGEAHYYCSIPLDGESREGEMEERVERI